MIVPLPVARRGAGIEGSSAGFVRLIGGISMTIPTVPNASSRLEGRRKLMWFDVVVNHVEEGSIVTVSNDRTGRGAKPRHTSSSTIGVRHERPRVEMREG